MEKRYSTGSTLISSYVFSKAIDDCDNDGIMASAITTLSITAASRKAGRYDLTHRSVSCFVYEVPFGKDRKWMNGGICEPGCIHGRCAGQKHLRWARIKLDGNVSCQESRFQGTICHGVRYDIKNVFDEPNFANPSAVVNLNSPGLFGKPVGTVGGWCCLGGQFVSTLVLKSSF